MVGVTKQTVLYWFPSKDELLEAVVDWSANELAVSVGAAVQRAGEGFEVVEAVVRAVFRPAIRRPALLGLIRELNRLGPVQTDRLLDGIAPLVERAKQFMATEMDAGRMRRGDPAARAGAGLFDRRRGGDRAGGAAGRRLATEPGVAPSPAGRAARLPPRRPRAVTCLARWRLDVQFREVVTDLSGHNLAKPTEVSG